ncbi:hypothetical protein IH781_02285, partial [Patescibacteria group bacterium]|nr:hypothetical protein [Patescibacteria group bacterium]
MISHQTPPTTITSIYRSALPLGLLAGFVYLVNLFENYDWGHPWVKFLAYLAMFATVLILAKTPKAPPTSALTTKLELVALSILLVIIIMNQAPTIIPLLTQPAQVDIGQITAEATTMLFKDHKNPYTSMISPFWNNPKYSGYKYGPMMLVGFGLNAVSSPL